MIRINQLKMPRTHSEEELAAQCAKMLRVDRNAIRKITIVRKSLDARKKPVLTWVYIVDVQVTDEAKVLKKNKSRDIGKAPDQRYKMPVPGEEPLHTRPVVIGAGPCGLFCAYLLAKNGYAPLVIERGKEASRRLSDVEHFWKTGELDLHSNVQFGEGGAGTFSDGKLNTLVKDSNGRNGFVRETFVNLGAPLEILYQHHPHLGTDQLIGIVERMREEIISLGGTFRFETLMTDISVKDGKIDKILLNDEEWLPVEVLVLAIGHSARDTIEMLYTHQLPMQAKPFAVGHRVEHPQTLINLSQYGEAYPEDLSAAEYKVTATPEDDRGVYSFCMCPGGFVVNASSEAGRLAVNGMSNHDRGEANANSAIVVAVRPEDYAYCISETVPECLSGMAFQRELEERAYEAGQGKIPVQRYADYKEGKPSETLGDIRPNTKGEWTCANVREILPESLSETFILGMESFGRKIPGFNGDDVLIEGMESRTSSPIRILRDPACECEIRGIYPAGEGAGYAGGIMSAAMDGMKVAESLITRYSLRDY